MEAIVPIHEHVRSLHGDPLAAGAGARGRRRAGEALTDGRRQRGRPGRPDPACRAAARRGPPARRQVDQPPGVDHGRAGRGREPDPRRGRRRGCALDGGHHRSPGRVGGAGRRRRPERRLPGDLARRRRPARACRGARLRELRDEPAAGCRDDRRTAAEGGPGWGQFIAPPTGGSYHRTAALDGRGAPGTRRRLPPSTHRGRCYPAPTDRLPDPGAKCPGQVGDPSRGAPGGGTDDGSRGGRDPGSHGANAPGPGDPRRTARRLGCGGLDGRRRADGARDRGAGSRRRVGGCLLARRGRDPRGRRAHDPGRRRQPDAASRHRHPALDGRADRGTTGGRMRPVPAPRTSASHAPT